MQKKKKKQTKPISFPISPAPLSASNSSLDYLQSTLGRSYLCSAEQTLPVVAAFSLNTFRLQVQPFGVTTGQFSTGQPLSQPASSYLTTLVYFILTLSTSFNNNKKFLFHVEKLPFTDFQMYLCSNFLSSLSSLSPAEECQMDQDQMLIPIIVGASLAGLVLVVLIAYLIGRKRSHAGYQTI